MAIALRPLIDEVLNPSRTLGKSAAADRLVERALQVRSEVGRFRPLPLALWIAAHALWELERRRRATIADFVTVGPGLRASLWHETGSFLSYQMYDNTRWCRDGLHTLCMTNSERDKWQNAADHRAASIRRKNG